MKKFVVYTVLTGNYDDLLQPVAIDDRFDYVLFTNDSVSAAGVWSIRPIPDVTPGDNKRLSRYSKTHPETLLADYAASLYIDANIQIQDQWVYDRVVELYENNIEYAGIKLVLTGRDCIYEHALDMCQWFVEDYRVAIRQCHQLYKLGFPKHFGLNENNVIFRTHTERMKAVDAEWWDWILNYSSRDQFSYMYCLWHNNVPLNYFLQQGEDTRNGSHFLLLDHNGKANVQKTKLLRRNLIRRLLAKNNSLAPDKSLARWESCYKSGAPAFCYYNRSFLSIFLNTPKLMAALLRGHNDR